MLFLYFFFIFFFFHYFLPPFFRLHLRGRLPFSSLMNDDVAVWKIVNQHRLCADGVTTAFVED